MHAREGSFAAAPCGLTKLYGLLDAEKTATSSEEDVVCV